MMCADAQMVCRIWRNDGIEYKFEKAYGQISNFVLFCEIVLGVKYALIGVLLQNFMEYLTSSVKLPIMTPTKSIATQPKRADPFGVSLLSKGRLFNVKQKPQGRSFGIFSPRC